VLDAKQYSRLHHNIPRVLTDKINPHVCESLQVGRIIRHSLDIRGQAQVDVLPHCGTVPHDSLFGLELHRFLNIKWKIFAEPGCSFL
jgi:hypothetical protein